jgi:hypothetical protein
VKTCVSPCAHAESRATHFAPNKVSIYYHMLTQSHVALTLFQLKYSMAALSACGLLIAAVGSWYVMEVGVYDRMLHCQHVAY